jgi:ACS family hexuronate transporter-like MFS transporter
VLVLNYADRAALGVAGPRIIDDLGLTKSEFGLLSSIFFVGYAPFCFIGGWLSDRYGPRSIMGIAVGWWSIFTALTAAGAGFMSMLLLRFLFGFGEGPQGAVSTKTMRNWFPQREMGTAMGLTQGATPLGGVIGTPLVAGIIAVTGSWRVPFIILGILGVLCAIGWFAVVRDRPDLHTWAAQRDIDEQREQIAPLAATGTNEGHGSEPARPLREYLTTPLVLATAVAFFGYAWVLYTFLTWFPIYLVEQQGVDIKGLGFAGAVPWVFGVAGLIVGGVVTDRLGVRTGRPARARRLVIVGGLLVTAVLFSAISLVNTAGAAVALMAAVVFMLYITGAQYFAIIADVVPSQRLGGVMGFVHAIANLAGILAPAVVGFMVNDTGSWAATFVVSGAICVVGALTMAIFGRARAGAPSPG